MDQQLLRLNQQVGHFNFLKPSNKSEQLLILKAIITTTNLLMTTAMTSTSNVMESILNQTINVVSNTTNVANGNLTNQDGGMKKNFNLASGK